MIITDAPCHGKKYHDGYHDDFPDGSPDGLVLENLLDEFSRKDIEMHFFKLNSRCDKMLNIMR